MFPFPGSLNLKLFPKCPHCGINKVPTYLLPQICNKTNLTWINNPLGFCHNLTDLPHTSTDLLHLKIFKGALEPYKQTCCAGLIRY